MIQDREEWLADTLVTLADTLTADFDIAEFLLILSERIQELIDGSEVGLVLVDLQEQLRVVACTTERARLIELLEVQAHEGPCWDCYRNGHAVANVDLGPGVAGAVAGGAARAEAGGVDAALSRWPVFTPMARAAGFQMVHALPMRLRDQMLGAASIFGRLPTVISESDLHLAQALADVATIGLLQERAVHRASDLAGQLQHALDSRIAIEQAKGAVAERAGVDMDTAFRWLRGYARSNNLRLAGVARAVVERSLPVETLATTGLGSAEA